MITAKIIFILVVGGGVLLLLNWPLFQFIDNLFYGSSEAAAQAVREGEAHEREVRKHEAGNVFNQIESLVNDGRVFRSDYRRSLTMGEFAKIGIIVIELLLIGSWFLHG